MSGRFAEAGRRRPALVVVLAAGVLMGACGSTNPTATVAGPLGTPPAATASVPAPTPTVAPTAEPPSVIYARIEQQVEALRGLTADGTVLDPVVLDDTALAAALRTNFDRSEPPAALAAAERLDRALGLIPADASLRDLELKLLDAQVAGFYDPKTKRMSVRSTTGSIGALEQIAFAHEFDHALQDQHFDLTRLATSDLAQGDRSLARLSLAEGDATILMTQWAQSALTPLQLLQYLGSADLQGQTALLDTLPQALRDQLFFPYTSGLAFVQGLYAQGGWAAVDAAYARPPDSTEQILHPEKYAADERPVTIPIPTDLAKRLGAGWTVDLQDTFGEFGLRDWLQVVGGVPADVAADAAAGWGGDRVVMVSDGSAFAIAIQTAWDTPADATAFAAAADTTRAKLAASTALIDPGTTDRVTVFVGSDAAAIARLAGALGLAG